MPSFTENSVKRLDRAQSPRLTLRGDESTSPKERRGSETLVGDGGSKEQSVLQASEFAFLSFGSMSKYAPAAFCRGRVFARKGGKSLCGHFHPVGRAKTALRHSRGVCCLLFGRVCRNAGRRKPQKQPRGGGGGRRPAPPRGGGGGGGAAVHHDDPVGVGGRGPPGRSLAVPACRPALRADRQGPPPFCACRRLSASRRTNQNAPRLYAPQGVCGGRDGARPAQPLSKAGL